MTYGNFPISLSDIKVAVLSAAGTYGTAIAVPGITFSIKPNLTSDKLAQFGKTARIASHVIDADVAFSGGGYPFDVLEAILGATVTTGGTTPSQEDSAPIAAGSLLPKFGLVGKAVAEDGGDLHLGCPVVRLTELPDWKMDGESNTFVKGEMKGLAVADSSGNLIYPLAHETEGDIDFTEIFA